MNEKFVAMKQLAPHFASQTFAMKRRDRIADHAPEPARLRLVNKIHCARIRQQE